MDEKNEVMDQYNATCEDIQDFMAMSVEGEELGGITWIPDYR